MKSLRFLLPAAALAMVFSYGSLTGWGAPPKREAHKDKVADKWKEEDKDLQKGANKGWHKGEDKGLHKGELKDFPKGPAEKTKQVK